LTSNFEKYLPDSPPLDVSKALAEFGISADRFVADVVKNIVTRPPEPGDDLEDDASVKAARAMVNSLIISLVISGHGGGGVSNDVFAHILVDDVSLHFE
jgi:hypothetical protein